MKSIKKMLALVIAGAMMISSAVFAADTAKITIKKGKNDSAEHTYEAYQIFKGTVKDGKLTEIQWGDNGSDALGTALATAFASSTTETTKLAADGTTKMKLGEVFDAAKIVNTAAAYAEAIGLITTPADLETLTDTINSNKSGNAKVGDNTGVSGLTPGYYLVKDKDASLDGKENGAYTKFILRLLDTDIEVKEKAEVPSVEKEVQDEVADAEAGADSAGFGKTADHAINESFQFRVTATIPKDVNIANYETYQVMFTDTMSKGVTFDSIESVAVGTTPIAAFDQNTNPTGYKLEGVQAGEAGKKFTITIDDLKKHVTLNGDQAADITIVVVYNAHLNENAIIRDESGTAVVDNNNKVKLTYSNNADAYGGGKPGETPEETVFVFTYKALNTKYADKVDDDHKLPGAGFTLKDSNGNVVSLFYDSTLKAYRLPKDGETAVQEMKSQDDGTFNIVGLDSGKYTIEETTVPTGYNKCKDIEVEITSVHVRNSDKANASVTLTTSNITNSVLNQSGTTLPETGGIGTTIFYAMGAILVLGAGILLVSKRRAA